jgi:hypothetical protein
MSPQVSLSLVKSNKLLMQLKTMSGFAHRRGQALLPLNEQQVVSDAKTQGKKHNESFNIMDSKSVTS